MTRPRRPFGPDQPGRVAATMLKVLAAEMSDAGRLTRGKRLWSDRAVVDIEITPGAAIGQVQGSRPTPYEVIVATGVGHGVPARREVAVRCSCPDDTGDGSWACKHVVATLFALSDEVAIEPDVLTRWRRTDEADDAAPRTRLPTSPARSDDADRDADRDDDDRDDDDRDASDDAALVDPLAPYLRPPEGARVPPRPVLSDAVHPRFPDEAIEAVLVDVRAALTMRWE